MRNKSLVAVGTGIKFLAHLTVEAKAYIEQADIILYLLNEPAIQEWIKKINKNSHSLEPIYKNYALRLDSYKAISNHILEVLNHHDHVCVALYGHPTVFAMPALDAIKKAKKMGIDTKILPGISAEACLFADLYIDPAEYGCQSFDATDFLIRQRPFSSHSYLILWQIGVVGSLNFSSQKNMAAMQQLSQYLLTQYDINHQITIYEAAQYPHMQPKIENIPLSQLTQFNFSKIATLLIKPIRNLPTNHDILNLININQFSLV